MSDKMQPGEPLRISGEVYEWAVLRPEPGQRPEGWTDGGDSRGATLERKNWNGGRSTRRQCEELLPVLPLFCCLGLSPEPCFPQL